MQRIDNYFLDPRRVRRAFDRASSTFDRFAGVHTELRNRLLERLDLVRLTPSVVMDLGAGTGHASRALQSRYRDARVVAVDASHAMLVRAKQQQRFFNRFDRIVADAQRLGVRSASVDLVFSNLMLQWCADPDGVFAEVARVLRPGGLVTFTSLGPDSLRELREAADQDRIHVHRFIDMHDIGDALMRAGFAEPVMDTERLAITYPSAQSLFEELKGSGSANIALGAPKHLQSSRSLSQLAARVPTRDSKLSITLEVVYGHAWATDRPARGAQTGVTSIPVSSIGRRVR